jgi:hypothetical protein
MRYAIYINTYVENETAMYEFSESFADLAQAEKKADYINRMTILDAIIIPVFSEGQTVDLFVGTKLVEAA